MEVSGMGNIERYRADHGRVWLEGPGESYPREIAECVTDHDAEKIARALNDHEGAVSAERKRVVERLVEMADALDQDAVARTAETLRRAAAVLDVEGGR